MRVLHVYKDYPPVLGGIEGHIATLAEGQARRGLEVTVLATRPRGLRCQRQLAAGIEVVRAGAPITLRSTPLAPALLSGFVHEMRRRPPDVVHLHLPFPPGELLHLVLGGGRTSIVSYHSDIVRQRLLGAIWRPWQRRLLQRADRVLVASEAYRRRSPMLSSPDVQTAIVPYGIALPRFAEPRTSAVEAWQRLYAGPRVLFVGRLRYYKGVEHLIDAAARLENAQLLIAGRGPREAELKRRAATSQAAPRIHFLGDVDDHALPSLYAAADLVVLPSIAPSEAFGIVLVEAMAAGTPVISTELGTGTSEINIDRETGLVVPPGDAGALAGAIRDLLSDHPRRRSMAAAARSRAASTYDSEVMIERINVIYRRALEAPHAPQ